LGFAPLPRGRFAFLAAYGCACVPTSLPMGDETAMNLEETVQPLFEASDIRVPWTDDSVRKAFVERQNVLLSSAMQFLQGQ
jgi:hypothetical protein